jgi:hypothetical protein
MLSMLAACGGEKVGNTADANSQDTAAADRDSGGNASGASLTSAAREKARIKRDETCWENVTASGSKTWKVKKGDTVTRGETGGSYTWVTLQDGTRCQVATDALEPGAEPASPGGGSGKARAQASAGDRMRLARDETCWENVADAGSKTWNLKAGTIVTKRADQGSYTLVKLQDGTECQVESDALESAG